MSDFIDALINMLSVNSELQKPNNQLRQVLDNSVGAYFDDHNTDDFADNLFLNTANGKYLDLHGRDYNIPRKIDESDEDYRLRIIQEKTDKLTLKYLAEVFDLTVYNYVTKFNIDENTLTSDNPYISKYKMAIDKNNISTLLKNKFIMDNVLVWVYDNKVDYIIEKLKGDVLFEYINIYGLKNCTSYFKGKPITEIRLMLLNAESTAYMFMGNTPRQFLESVELTIPNVTTVKEMFTFNVGLKKVVLNMPKCRIFKDMFRLCDMLKYIEVTIPSDMVNEFKLEVCNSSLSRLETLIINGEEVQL
ncbi:hypothetical protein [Methanobrevibacter sp.]